MTMASLCKGEPYGDMRETYVIFICGYDPFGKELPLYTGGRVICDQDESVALLRGCRFAYVNCAHRDESTDLGRLVHDIKCSDYSGMYSAVLSKRAKSVKSSITFEEGSMIMTVTEELRREAIREGRAEGMKQGIKEGREQGIKQGIKEGIEEGIKEGELKGRKNIQVESAERMLQAGVPVHDIAKYLGMTAEEVESVAALV